MIDLGLRLDDIEDLEREPAAATRTTRDTLRDQLAENIPDDDLLSEAYQAFHHSQQLREIFEEAENEYEEAEIEAPKDLKTRVHVILKKHTDLRWDDAIRLVLDETQLDHVREKKQEAREKSGDFADTDDEDDI